VVKNKHGNILISEEEITMRWKEYLQDLYEGNNETTENNIVIEEIYHVGEVEIGPSIMKSEFINAIHDLK
jgi:predicted nucleic acid-binding protein